MTMQVFEHRDYVSCLRGAIAARKAASPSFTLARIAASTKIQRTYLSHVFAGRAHLSRDQLFRIADLLALSEEESDYLLLLLDLERCEVPRRKERLQREADAWRRKYSISEQAIARKGRAVSEAHSLVYYSDPLCSMVHMLLLIEKYRTNVRAITST